MNFGGWQLELKDLRGGEAIQAVGCRRRAEPAPCSSCTCWRRQRVGIERPRGGRWCGCVHRLPVRSVGTRVRPPRRSLDRRGMRTARPQRLGDGRSRDRQRRPRKGARGRDLGTCAAKADVVSGVRCDADRRHRGTPTATVIRDGPETMGRRSRVREPRAAAVGSESHATRTSSSRSTSCVERRRRTTRQTRHQDASRRRAQVRSRTTATPATASDSALQARTPRRCVIRTGGPGISVHLDTGVRPVSPEGRDDLRGLGRPQRRRRDRRRTTSGRESTSDDAWKEEMREARRGYFHHALAYARGRRADRAWASRRRTTSTERVSSRRTRPATASGSATPAHYGIEPDVNCKPNYPSLMNYAYQGSTLVFSDGRSSTQRRRSTTGRFQETDAVEPERDGVPGSTGSRTSSSTTSTREHGHVDWNRDGRVRARAHARSARTRTTDRAAAAASTRAGTSSASRGDRARSRLRSPGSTVGSWCSGSRTTERLLYTASSKSQWYCPNAGRERLCGDAEWTGGRSFDRGRDRRGRDPARATRRRSSWSRATLPARLWEWVVVRAISVNGGDDASWRRIRGRRDVGQAAPALARVAQRDDGRVPRPADGTYRHVTRLRVGELANGEARSRSRAVGGQARCARRAARRSRRP